MHWYGHHRSTSSQCVARPFIFFPLSATSRGLAPGITSFEQLPLFQHALPSVIESIEPARYRYALAIAADRGDRWYDNADTQRRMLAWFQTQWKRHWPDDACGPPTLTFHVYANTRSRNTWAVNYVTQLGYEAGADYFYRINDDTRLLANNWSSVFVHELAQMRPIPGLGVTGPGDAFAGKRLLTHSFVSRRHIECFGTHFPFVFGNWYSDDWIQRVYSEPYPDALGAAAEVRMMSIREDIEVHHAAIDQRYTVKATATQLERQLAIDREELHVYIAERLHEP